MYKLFIICTDDKVWASGVLPPTSIVREREKHLLLRTEADSRQRQWLACHAELPSAIADKCILQKGSHLRWCGRRPRSWRGSNGSCQWPPELCKCWIGFALGSRIQGRMAVLCPASLASLLASSPWLLHNVTVSWCSTRGRSAEVFSFPDLERKIHVWFRTSFDQWNVT